VHIGALLTGVVTLLASVVGPAGAPSPSASASASTSASGAPAAGPRGHGAVTIPARWRTYAYADALISAPAEWQVERNDPCPSSDAPGLLVLGAPQGIVYSCPMERWPPSSVFVAVGARPTPGRVPTGGARRVNGLVVVPLPTTSGSIGWWVPALSLTVNGQGPGAAAVLGTVRPLVPTPLGASCQEAAVRAALPWVDRRLGVTSWPAPSAVGSVRSALPVPPEGFGATYPQFVPLVDTALQVFATLTGVPGSTPAFYSATLDPSRQLILHGHGCTGRVAGVETLEGSVSPTVLGAPWDMVAVTEPGWWGGAVFFRGGCPGGVQPSASTSPCRTVSVWVPAGEKVVRASVSGEPGPGLTAWPRWPPPRPPGRG